MKKLCVFIMVATLLVAAAQAQHVEPSLDSMRMQFESEARFAVEECEAYSEQARAE